MRLLVLLHVKFGYPLESLYGFLGQMDRDAWDDFHRCYSYDVCACPEGGQVYLLIGECFDLEKFISQLVELPLIKEGFLEFQVHEFGRISSLNILFTYSKFKESLVAEKS